MQAGAIILSGGKSSRMGTNKALLKFEEKTNIQRIYEELKKFSEDIILVTNDSESYDFLKIKMTADHFPGQGPLAGIHAGLLASPFEVNIVAACDMPFISSEVAKTMAERLGDYDAAIPVINGKQQPLFAAFRKGIIPDIQQCLENDELRMKHLFNRLNVCYLTEKDLLLDEDGLERVFFNMNRPEEYEEAKKKLKE